MTGWNDGSRSICVHPMDAVACLLRALLGEGGDRWSRWATRRTFHVKRGRAEKNSIDGGGRRAAAAQGEVDPMDVATDKSNCGFTPVDSPAYILGWPAPWSGESAEASGETRWMFHVKREPCREKSIDDGTARPRPMAGCPRWMSQPRNRARSGFTPVDSPAHIVRWPGRWSGEVTEASGKQDGCFT
jgi:hypothetical protein